VAAKREGKVKAKINLENIGDMEATLTLTMTVNEWSQLKAQIDQSDEHHRWPTWVFLRTISNLISKARGGYESVDDEVKP
jgi:hypothetical protein